MQALYNPCFKIEIDENCCCGDQDPKTSTIVLTVKSRLTDFSRQMSNEYASVTLSLLGNKADPRKVLKQYRK